MTRQHHQQQQQQRRPQRKSWAGAKFLLVCAVLAGLLLILTIKRTECHDIKRIQYHEQVS